MAGWRREPNGRTSMIQTNQRAKANHQISKANCLLALLISTTNLQESGDILPTDIFRYSLSPFFRLRLIILPYFSFIE